VKRRKRRGREEGKGDQGAIGGNKEIEKVGQKEKRGKEQKVRKTRGEGSNEEGELVKDNGGKVEDEKSGRFLHDSFPNYTHRREVETAELCAPAGRSSGKGEQGLLLLTVPLEKG